MSIKPCPACESDYDGDWSHGTAGPQLVCGNPGCKLCGPCGIDMEDAEKRWNAMPRRGDGPAWRSEPPDAPGWWLAFYRNPVSGRPMTMDAFHTEDIEEVYRRTGIRYRENRHEFWCGPIPEPPAPDAEKEAAK